MAHFQFRHAAVDQVAARVAVIVTLQDEVHTQCRERLREVQTALLVVGVVRVVGGRVDRVVVDEDGVLGLGTVLLNDVGDETDVRRVGVDSKPTGMASRAQPRAATYILWKAIRPLSALLASAAGLAVAAAGSAGSPAAP